MTFHPARCSWNLLATTTALLSFSPNAFTQAPSAPRTITAVRTLTVIEIDGRLTEEVWQRAGLKGLVQREPHEGAAGSEETEIWVAYDDDALYVAAYLYDSSPDSIQGRLVRRDDDFRSDFFYFGVDPDFDRRSAYYFGTNPAGSINDGILYDDNKTDDSYDGVWDVGVQVEQRGWIAEFRIPFSQLRFSRHEARVWGFDVYRRIHRKNEEEFLVLHPRNDDIRVSRWIELRGLENIDPPARIELLPYVTGTGKFIQQPPVNSFNVGRKDPFVLGRDYRGSVGADAKIGLSGNFTLNATVNPDFAQVEVDPAVVNLTAYEVYFAEKRPFFLEGSNILQFGRGGAASFTDYNWSDPDFFYSRRIGGAPTAAVTHKGFTDAPDRATILGAAKVSGQTSDGWSLAALTALTNRNFGVVDSAGVRFEEEVEPLTFYGVMRAQGKFNESRHALGMIATVVERDLREQRLKELLNRRAISFAVDGWTFLDAAREWVITGWTGMSTVQGSKARMISLQQSPEHYFQRPDARQVVLDSSTTSLTGWAGRVWLNKDKGNWRFNVAVGAIDPSFESNDLGFHNYTDVINTHLYTGYLWFEPDPIFRTKSLAVATHRDYNFGGLKTGETYYLNLNGQLLNYWDGSIFAGFNAEAFDDRRTRGGPIMKSQASEFVFFSASSDSRQDVFGDLSVNADGGRSGGWDYGVAITLNWKISTALNISVGPSYTRNHGPAQYVDTLRSPATPETFGISYVFATIDRRTLSSTMRVNWTFTPKLSFQLYVQPYLSTGDYTGFKRLAKPGTFTFTPISYTKSNPDLNFKSLRANAVLRWEYLPGSTLYLAWTNVKFSQENHGIFKVGRDFSELLRTAPDNIFSLKITYWWSP